MSIAGELKSFSRTVRSAHVFEYGTRSYRRLEHLAHSSSYLYSAHTQSLLLSAFIFCSVASRSHRVSSRAPISLAHNVKSQRSRSNSAKFNHFYGSS